MKITDKIEITNECNMELMKRYPDGYFQLGIIDPEYGIGESSKNHKSRNTPIRQKDGSLLKAPNPVYQKTDWDSKPAGDDFFKELFRVTQNQIIFGANYFEFIQPVFKSPRRHEFDQFIKDNPKNYIIWDKVNGTNDFNDCEVIWTSLHIDPYVLPYMWAGMMQGVSIPQGTVAQGNKKLNEKRIHPTQKPVLIYKYLLYKYSDKSFNNLDTNIGSGSQAIACFDYGYKLTACEKNQDIYNSCIKRCKDHFKQPLMFQ